MLICYSSCNITRIYVEINLFSPSLLWALRVPCHRGIQALPAALSVLRCQGNLCHRCRRAFQLFFCQALSTAPSLPWVLGGRRLLASHCRLPILSARRCLVCPAPLWIHVARAVPDTPACRDIRPIQNHLVPPSAQVLLSFFEIICV